jgi:dTDP-4-amino-4,6-dideoxygalactose transaminase
VEPDYPLSRDALYARLKEYGIVTRRYFYPLISNFPMYRGMDSAAPANLPVANLAASRVLCLPIYPALGEDDLERIIDLVRGWARS